MSAKKASEEEINRILNSLDGMQRADAPSFFYTRLSARLDKMSSGISRGQRVGRPVLLMAGLCLLVVLNVSVIRMVLRDKSVKQPASHKTNGLQSFASAYDLTNSSIYNTENIAP
jgi:hypothetical protein